MAGMGEGTSLVSSSPHCCFLELRDVRRDSSAGDRSSKDI